MMGNDDAPKSAHMSQDPPEYGKPSTVCSKWLFCSPVLGSMWERSIHEAAKLREILMRRKAERNLFPATIETLLFASGGTNQY